jgi:transcription antitermination factor NusG
MFHGQRWHVVYTAINAEACARDEICKLGFPVFVPFEKRIRRLPNRKPFEYRTAYFPRYGFVRFDLDQNWPAILGAKGVVDLLRNNGIPIPVPDRAVDALKVADRIGLFDKTKPPAVGMEVEVTAGPFSGLLGRIMRARTGDRMDVLLKMFGETEITATIPLMALRENAK